MSICSRLHSLRATRASAPRATFTGSAGFSTRPLPRTCDRRCPGQTDRGSPAPLTSDREGAALDWPNKPIRPLISQQPGWRLLPQKEKTPPDATPRGQPLVLLGAMALGLARFEVVLADRTRLQRSKGHHTRRPQAPLPPETTVFGEMAAKGGSAHPRQKGSSCCARCAT